MVYRSASKETTDHTVKSTKKQKRQYVDDSSAEQNTDASVGEDYVPSQTPKVIEQNCQGQVAMRAREECANKTTKGTIVRKALSYVKLLF